MGGGRSRGRGGRRPSLLPEPRRSSPAVSSVARSAREGVGPIAPRLAIAGIFGIVLIGILVLRLWALTVIGGAEYVERADSNVIRKLPVAAPRGSILDRRGRQIVINREMRQVVVDLQDVDPDRIDGLVGELGRVLAPNKFEIGKTQREIRQAINGAAPGQIEPVIVAKDVKDDAVVHYLAEHAADFPGVDVREAYARDYLKGPLAAHILGQVGKVSDSDLKQYPSLQLIDSIGKSGLEYKYDQYLRGTNGYDAVEVDAAGVRSDSGLRGLPPVPGRNLVTTIDLKLQKVAEKALAESVRRVSGTASGRSAKAGAVVAIDPRNGEILTMASFPDYDPNVFVNVDKKSQRIAAKLNKDNRRIPLLNRAIQGTYPAGSTFKPITALAAMHQGLLTPDKLIPCPPSMNIMGTKFPNNTDLNLGAIDLKTAIEVSCNTYFYTLGIGFFNAPGSPLQKYAEQFGLGRETGVDIPGEATGVMPTPKWRRETFKDAPEIDRIWKLGYSVNLSIGQGDLRVTPLQMATAYATIANGGTYHTPHIGKSIQEPGGRDVVEIPPGESHDLGLDPVNVAAVKEGMQLVNNGPVGTASAVFQGFKVNTAGKTGTAEMTSGTDTGWYCGFAPVENPTITVCAVVDGGGHGGTAAAPIVLQMFQDWFGADGGNAGGGGGSD
ncbi:MAG: penicillin-binding protein 2 [Thermoleophilia bacterium]|nr:penicillin-binding protein 2 [Thermoleophilia bacterium]